ncbi:MAG: lipocalin-like domain-containing protein [Verrucomicrobiota bacterium]
MVFRPPVPPWPMARLRVWAVLLGLGGPALAAEPAFRPPAFTPDGFAVPQPGRTFQFPRDHGSHPEFKVEWWYVTGHLESGKQRFGFQATFFRSAAPRPSAPGAAPAAAPASFGTGHLHLAHLALLDASSGRFLHQSRLNRDGWDAGSATNQLAVHNGNWFLRQESTPAPSDPGRPSLQLAGAIRGEAAIRLRLVPRKPLVAFGEQGVSRKAAGPTAASHYLTFTRLAAEGSLELGGRTLAVAGEAWMDHEISSSQLDPDQAGWDWACLQLDDGREVMAYRLRKVDGSTDPFSTLAWIDTQGGVQHAGPDRFRWEPAGHWTSPLTRARYPNRVRITTRDPESGRDRTFLLEPLAEAQELTDPLGGVAYWEGACRVREADGRVVGRAFLELAGYVGRLADRFR